MSWRKLSRKQVLIPVSILAVALIVLNGYLRMLVAGANGQAPSWGVPSPGPLPTEAAFAARMPFFVHPTTPIEDLLPAAPRGMTQKPPWEIEHLTDVPEVCLIDPQVYVHFKTSDIAQQTAKINFLNAKGPDEYVRALCRHRQDLAGLPFAMGADCRLSKADWSVFAASVSAIHSAVTFSGGADESRDMSRFWTSFHRNYGQKTNGQAVAALMQILGAEFCHPELARHLAKSTTKDATLALTRLAVFAVDAQTRLGATLALKKRDTTAAVKILSRALRYPWPDVARHAADAIVELRRTDLAPQLTEMLDQPDPRAPVLQQVEGKMVPVVRELVRINHRRNCLLCHAPAGTPDLFGSDAMKASGAPGRLAGVPTPDTTEYYGTLPSPDVMVRTDVTYLRQDFSLMETDLRAKPSMQRFDYLVRTRVLTEREAETYRARFGPGTMPSPYRDIALKALRRLTGTDAAAG